jgi:phosphatidylserine/phosphatidylglycerophosphate/cardiolipin synthase-like enzyme
LNNELHLIQELDKRLQTAAVLLSWLSKQNDSWTFDTICKGAEISQTLYSEALIVLSIFRDKGIVLQKGDQWKVGVRPENIENLANLIRGAALKDKIERRKTNAEKTLITLTRPRKPSRLGDVIQSDKKLRLCVEDTGKVFRSMAAQAKNRFVIMTPFLDHFGAKWVVSLFQNSSPNISKVLILRFLDRPNMTGYPEGYLYIEPQLKEMGVVIYDFSLPREGETMLETFHAKAVCADNSMVYVGSSNMNVYSREHSMELGVIVKGITAVRLAAILDKIMKIAKRV